jgi:uncharacterized membrane protein (UPF0127 family)
MRRVLLALPLLLGSGCAEDVVTIRGSDDGVVLRASLIGRAETATERMEGLRGRTLEAGEGLLIAFPVEDEVCITNGGVTQAIDAVFIGGDAAVTHVERAVPAGDGSVRCATGQWILEVLAGEAEAVEPVMSAEGL